jgi:crotonobetaine/carnitine-CoA ligase
VKRLSEPTSARTLGDLLAWRVTADRDRVLLQVGEARRTASQLHDGSIAIATTLRSEGIESGDRVAIIADNTIEFVELWLGCALLGAVLVPLNTASRGPQMTHVLNDSQPRVFVVAEEHLARVVELEERPGSITHVWVHGEATHTEWVGTPVSPFPALVPASGSRPLDAPALDDAAALLYTSGTTGPSKGVVCPHSHLYWWGVNTARVLGVREEDVLYSCLPLFHINALNTIVQSLATGARAVIGPRFSASRFWQRLADADATVTYLLGAMVSILATREPDPLDRGHRTRVALAPATPPQLWPVFEERFGVALVEGHGMTETNLTIGPRDGLQRPGWMGRVMPGFHARVVDGDGDDVPPDTPGELLLKADDDGAFAKGYWRRLEETRAAWDGGWFHTGDRVLRDEQGYFRFVDRIKDAIRRRGENISAWEVEQAILMHPAVAAAAVVPVPSELGEDEVMAFVTTVERHELNYVALIRQCEKLLPYFAIPRYVEIVEQLPLTENGKIQKYILRERGISADTWDREQENVRLRR